MLIHTLHPILGALVIFCLRICDVSIGTVRLIMVTRNHRIQAAVLGAVEVTIWLVAVSAVLGNLTSPWHVVGYAGGFATGTYIGMFIEGKLALGTVEVQIISLTSGKQIAQALRDAGWAATLYNAEGRSGNVSNVSCIVPRRQQTGVIRLIDKIDPQCFVTVREARQYLRGYHRLAK